MLETLCSRCEQVKYTELLIHFSDNHITPKLNQLNAPIIKNGLFICCKAKYNKNVKNQIFEPTAESDETWTNWFISDKLNYTSFDIFYGSRD